MRDFGPASGKGLAWDQVDLGSGIIRVERAWDPKSHQFIGPKSAGGRRRVPVIPILRDLLVDQKLRGDGEGLVWGSTTGGPFNSGAVRRRARSAWAAESLSPIGLHECRHTYASLMIAAGGNAKALSTYMGHANISVTYDLYGHLMPGNEEAAADLLNAYLERAQLNTGFAAVDL